MQEFESSHLRLVALDMANECAAWRRAALESLRHTHLLRCDKVHPISQCADELVGISIEAMRSIVGDKIDSVIAEAYELDSKRKSNKLP